MGTRIVVRCLIGAGMALALWLAGCGAMPGVVSSATNQGFSAIEKCRSVGATDGEIDVLFSAIRADRQAGYTATEELIAVFDVCSTNQYIGPSNCNLCATAIVDEVYGL